MKRDPNRFKSTGNMSKDGASNLMYVGAGFRTYDNNAVTKVKSPIEALDTTGIDLYIPLDAIQLVLNPDSDILIQEDFNTDESENVGFDLISDKEIIDVSQLEKVKIKALSGTAKVYFRFNLS